VTFWPDEDVYREQLEFERVEDTDEWQRRDEALRERTAADERQEGEPQ
jgi:hypothetical protein